jgi:hypothetical protein
VGQHVCLDIDVAASGKGSLAYRMGYTGVKTIEAKLVFVLEGRSEQELPERR